MKKIIFSLLVAFFALCGYAEHFNFMGIPLDGSIKNFEKQLQAKGFTYERDNEDNPNKKWYSGVYAGHNAVLLLEMTPKSHKVLEVSVGIELDSVEVAEKFYNTISDTVKQKYEVTKEISSSPDVVTYILENGTIEVVLRGRHVVISYLDKENNDIYNSEIEE